MPIAFGLIAAQKSWKVRFTTAADLVIAMEAAYRQGRMKEAMHRVIAAPKLLIIDEIGYLPFGRELSTGRGISPLLGVQNSPLGGVGDQPLM